MWIRTQDKKDLVSVIGVGVSKAFGGKKKGIVNAYIQGASKMDSLLFPVAHYATLEDAIREVDRFEEHIVNEPNGIFTFRE